MHEAELQAIKAKHPDLKLHLITIPGDGEPTEVVVKSPSRAIWQKFQDMTRNETTRPKASQTLVKDVLVHPDMAGYEALLEAEPGLYITIAAEVMEIAGLKDGATKKAL